MMYFLKTKNGYQLGEVMSALQKSIRRGKEEEALFWSLEMCPQFEAHLWSRLIITAYEDISVLAPGNIPTTISQMRQDYFWLRENGNSAALLVISNAILLLCRTPKTRISDNFLLAVGHRIDNGLQLEIPDYALDKHTRKGRQMGRGGKHFVEEGAKLNHIAEIDDPYKEETEARLREEHLDVQVFAWANEKRKKGQSRKKKGTV